MDVVYVDMFVLGFLKVFFTVEWDYIRSVFGDSVCGQSSKPCIVFGVVENKHDTDRTERERERDDSNENRTIH